MEFRNLGSSGLKVSLAGLGCNNFGMRVDEAETAAVVDAALDEGINFFDSADIYGGGKSEEFLGKALGKNRHKALIGTKFGIPTGEAANQGGGSRRYAIASCETSLRRLGTDYIDVYFLHTPDPDTPIGETLDAMNRLIDQGKVRYIGCSNFAGWQLADADWTAKACGQRGFITAQNEWSLLERGVEADVVPACEQFGIGLMPYFPLAGGALTGKYHRGEEFDKNSRYGSSEMMRQLYGRFVSDGSLERVEGLAKVAEGAGLSILELALSWLASRPLVSTVIAGATRPEQVKSNVASTRGDLGADVFEAVEKVLAA